MRWIQIGFRFGDFETFALSPPAGCRIKSGKGENLYMRSKPMTTQKMARETFGLLLELRARQDAHHSLAKALAFLEVLVREKDIKAAPMMLSIRVMELRKS